MGRQGSQNDNSSYCLVQFIMTIPEAAPFALHPSPRLVEAYQASTPSPQLERGGDVRGSSLFSQSPKGCPVNKDVGPVPPEVFVGGPN